MAAPIFRPGFLAVRGALCGTLCGPDAAAPRVPPKCQGGACLCGVCLRVCVCVCALFDPAGQCSAQRQYAQARLAGLVPRCRVSWRRGRVTLTAAPLGSRPTGGRPCGRAFVRLRACITKPVRSHISLIVRGACPLAPLPRALPYCLRDSQISEVAHSLFRRAVIASLLSIACYTVFSLRT